MNDRSTGRRALRTFACLGTLVAACVQAGPASAATYFVSPVGSDSARGTSRAHPWRTIAKVNDSHFYPGDTILLEGGATFADAQLAPHDSGTWGRPITFASYGRGQAVIRQGVWLRDVRHLALENLDIDGGGRPPSYSSQGILTSNAGEGSPYMTVRRCKIRRWRLAVNLANAGDIGWLIADNAIHDIGESGILIEDDGETNGRGARGTRIERNLIASTGRADLPYALHGIYTRGPRTSIRGNTIERFRDSGVTFRFNDTTIVGNVIRGGREGITWYPYSEIAGVSTIAYNVVLDVIDGLFIDDAQEDIDAPQDTRESFVVLNNTFRTEGGVAVAANPKQSPAFMFANNIVTGASSSAYVLDYRPPTYVEKNNLWFARAGRVRWVYLGSTFTSLARLGEVSGRASGDRVGNPQLSRALVPTAGSPAIDRAARDVARYEPSCNGHLFSYCGSAPEIGAVERIPGGGARG